MSKRQGKSGGTSASTIDIDPKTAAVFKRKNYHILNRLGAGAFGTVGFNFFHHFLAIFCFCSNFDFRFIKLNESISQVN